jgi:outer membrane protein TolC
VVSQYLGVLRAKARVDSSKSRIQLAQALLDQATALHKAGVATGIDEVRAQVKLRQEEQGLIITETDVQTAQYALARLLNLPSGQEIQTTDTESFFTTADLPSDANVETAIPHRPELASVQSRKRAAESERSAASAASLPSLTFQGSWAEAGRSLPGMIPAYTYEFALSVPLFTGGRLRAEKRRAQIQVEQAAQSETEIRNRIAEQVKSSIAQWKAAKNEVAVANDALRLAREELNLAKGRFAAGVTDNIEVISAQDSLSRASDDRIDAYYRFSAARATLARATGRVEETFGRSR